MKNFVSLNVFKKLSQQEKYDLIFSERDFLNYYLNHEVQDLIKTDAYKKAHFPKADFEIPISENQACH